MRIITRRRKKNNKHYLVESVSLNDLLSEHSAPVEIDYLSIDTEGSEYEILSQFDFLKYSINIITVEHNFSSKRDDLFQLLYSKGYRRIFESISLFDDWYVKESIYNMIAG